MFSLKRTLRLMWLSVRSLFVQRRIQKRQVLFSQEQSEQHLDVLKKFIDEHPEASVIVVAVRTLREVNYIYEELHDLGILVKKVVLGTGEPAAFPCQYSSPYDVYIGTIGVLSTGWRSRAIYAAMFSFVPLGWERFKQIEYRMMNESTLYANGRFHKINGVPT